MEVRVGCRRRPLGRIGLRCRAQGPGREPRHTRRGCRPTWVRDVFVSVNKAIHRLKKADGYEASVAVDGFASDIYGKGPKYNIGPLGLHFASSKILAVGGGDLLDGAEVVRFYAISDKPGSIKCSEVMASSGPIAAGTSSVKGEGNFYALAPGWLGHLRDV